MINFLKPAIERRYELANSGIGTRRRKAEAICDYLKARPEDAHTMMLERERFYSACEDLLRDRDSERILLYFPLKLLENAPGPFRGAYIDAWYRLLEVEDVRENFHFGDCFELDARPVDGLERVVKCAHLTPWLLKFGYINKCEIQKILDKQQDNEVLLQSFKDTWECVRMMHVMPNDSLYDLASRTSHLPERSKPRPLYVSKKRLKWLEEKGKPVELLTPTAKLEGPFSDNVPAFEPELKEIVAHLRPSEIVLVGGSQLKGYGTTNSDLDIWNLRDLEFSDKYRPGSMHSAHLYFNTIWLGGEYVASNLEQVANRITGMYTDSVDYLFPQIRHKALERLENDLLQYRLLHKGFSRFTGINEFYVPEEMEGDCPFYTDKYRRIATMLYVKYVWL